MSLADCHEDCVHEDEIVISTSRRKESTEIVDKDEEFPLDLCIGIISLIITLLLIMGFCLYLELKRRKKARNSRKVSPPPGIMLPMMTEVTHEVERSLRTLGMHPRKVSMRYAEATMVLEPITPSPPPNDAPRPQIIMKIERLPFPKGGRLLPNT